MQPAARRDTKIAFFRAVQVKAGAGQVKESWEKLGHDEWARVFWGRGNERREAAAQAVQQVASFVVLDNAQTRGVTEKDRIVATGYWWNIGAPGIPVSRGELEFTATRGAAFA